MDIRKAIFRMDGLVQPHFCEEAVKFIDFENKEQMGVGSFEQNRIDDQIRNVEGFSLNDNLDKNCPDLRQVVSKKILFLKIKEVLKVPFMNYGIRFKNLDQKSFLNQVDCLKYGVNGKYDLHVDRGHDSQQRNLTCIINLNDDYEGGEFVFFNPETNEEYFKEKLGKGSIIIFPSNFLFPHSVKPITKGTRYSFVCWLS